MNKNFWVVIGVICFCFVFSAIALAAVERKDVEAALASGNTENAESTLVEALSSPDFGDRDWANIEFYNLSTTKDGIDAAIKKLEDKATSQPENMGLQRSIAEGYVRLKDWGKVVQIYENLVKKNPDDSVLNTRLKDYNMLAGNYDIVIKNLEPIVNANPDDAGNSDMLANAYVRAGKVDEAIALYKKKLEKDPNSAGLLGRYAQALADFGRLDEAAKEWNKASQSDPTNLFFKQKEAETYLALGKTQQAKKAFEELRDLSPDSQPWFKNAAKEQLQALEKK